ncbi:hypothetical protein ACFPPE_06460 [Agromyces tardus]|uniref:hypothetical protein n=1 Tax=Agromyces tardus TaxID=2583849 RepID=UPI0014856886|nr:hypothetical protein [Agromyces tardus]
MPQPAPSPARSPIARRRELGLVVVAGLLAVAVSVAVGMVVGANRAEGSAASAPTRPTPGSSSPVTPIVPIAGEATPATQAVEIPGDCAGIYVRDWAAELAPLVLNPAWTADPGAAPLRGSNDPVAAAQLADTTRLTCAWATPDGGGDLGVFTDVAVLAPDVEAAIAAHLAETGFDCYAELDGTRCIVEWNVEAGYSGESHFLRQGTWIATRWANVSPDGYTHDIVAAIFE